MAQPLPVQLISERLAEALDATLRARGLAARTLSESMGEHPDWVSRRLRSEVKMDLDFIQRCCRKLRLDPNRFITTTLNADPRLAPTAVIERAAERHPLNTPEDLSPDPHIRTILEPILWSPTIPLTGRDTRISPRVWLNIDYERIESPEAALRSTVLKIDELLNRPLQLAGCLGALANIYFEIRSKSLPPAIQLLRAAFTICRTYRRAQDVPIVEAFLNEKVARLLFLTGQTRDSIAFLDQHYTVLQDHPHPPTVVSMAAYHHLAVDDVAEALRLCRYAQAFVQTPQLRASLIAIRAFCFVHQKKREDALLELDKLGDLEGKITKLHFARLTWTRAKVLIELECHDEAKPLLRDLYQSSPLRHHPQHAANLILDRFDLDDAPPVHEIQDVVERLDPDDPIEQGLMRGLRSAIAPRIASDPLRANTVV